MKGFGQNLKGFGEILGSFGHNTFDFDQIIKMFVQNLNFLGYLKGFRQHRNWFNQNIKGFLSKFDKNINNFSKISEFFFTSKDLVIV